MGLRIAAMNEERLRKAEQQSPSRIA